ncbi:hypothetical protein [Bacillus sp. 1P06AnD]|uniref:hypothetical protein n=1 Tax=Bacillus sp. 1P06AnD TaxID=3132208 RepID=UPI0039A08C02
MKNYLTPEHYAIAELNGISEKSLKSRVYHQGWDIERAIMQPVKKQNRGKWKEWKLIAEKFGISRVTFNKRIKKGWDEKTAATHPVKRRGKINAQ